MVPARPPGPLGAPPMPPVRPPRCPVPRRRPRRRWLGTAGSRSSHPGTEALARPPARSRARRAALHAGFALATLRARRRPPPSPARPGLPPAAPRPSCRPAAHAPPGLHGKRLGLPPPPAWRG